MFSKFKVLCLSCLKFIRAATARLLLCAAGITLLATLFLALWGLMKLSVLFWALLNVITVADVVVVALITAAVYTAVRVVWFLLGVSLELAISSVESVSRFPWDVESVKFED